MFFRISGTRSAAVVLVVAQMVLKRWIALSETRDVEDATRSEDFFLTKTRGAVDGALSFLFVSRLFATTRRYRFVVICSDQEIKQKINTKTKFGCRF